MIDEKTLRELNELLDRIDAFVEDLPRLRKTLAYHIGQQSRQPSGQ